MSFIALSGRAGFFYSFVFVAAAFVAADTRAQTTIQMQQNLQMQEHKVASEPPKVVRDGDNSVAINNQSLNVLPSTVEKSPLTIQTRSAEVPQPAKSGPICGGVVNGKAQALCGAKPAKFESKAIGTCPAGSFFDIGLWQCWKCPSPYTRTTAGVTTDRACAVADGTVRGEFGPAKFVSKLCTEGKFDPIRGGECWECPKGFERSVFHIEAGNACHKWGGSQFFKATRYSKATGLIGTDCPRGQFWDAIDGFCYSCEGARRTEKAVNTDESCARDFGEEWGRATLRGQAKCQPGETQDPRNDGECWRCPEAWDRSVLAVNGSQACEKAGGLRFHKAEYASPLTCPANQIFDFVDGGTCWSCPAGYKRSMDPVKGQSACLAGTIDWFTAPYQQPGLFGLNGAADAVIELLQEKETLDNAFDELARGLGKPVDQVRKQGWTEIMNEPENSSVLRGLLFERVLDFNFVSQKSNAIGTLRTSFAEHIRNYRISMANDTLAAYDAWKVADQYWRGQDQSNNTNVRTLFDYGTVPPDFQEIIATGVWSGLAAGGAFGTMASGFIASPAGNRMVFPLSRRAAIRALGLESRTKKMAQEATAEIVKVSTKTSAKAGGQLGKELLGAFLKAGPQIAISLAVEVAAISIEDNIDIQNARPKLLAALATAQQPVDLRRMIASDQGAGDVVAMWALAVSGSAQPEPAKKQQIASLAPNLATIGALCLPANAQAPGIDPNAYYRLTTQWQGDSKSLDIVNDGRNNRPQLANTANVSGQFWKLTPIGNGYFRLTTQWQGDGKALDIVNDGKNNRPELAGAAGVTGQAWKITPIGGGWHRLTTAWQGDCMSLDIVNDGANNKPLLTPGANVTGQYWKLTRLGPVGTQAASLSPTQQQGSASVSWATVPGLAQDISIGANGAVWHIGTDSRPGGYGIYRWVNNAWVNVPGGAEKLAVDSLGNAWVVNNRFNILRWDGRQWVDVPGLAREIAIGANGTAWNIGTDQQPGGGGYGIYRLDGSSWTKMPGAAVKIAVDPLGNAWVVNDKGAMFKWDGRQWITVPGTAREIAIGANGTVWHVGTDGLYYSAGTGWSKAPGEPLVQITVGPDGKVWGANSRREIFRMQ